MPNYATVGNSGLHVFSLACQKVVCLRENPTGLPRAFAALPCRSPPPNLVHSTENINETGKNYLEIGRRPFNRNFNTLVFRQRVEHTKNYTAVLTRRD